MRMLKQENRSMALKLHLSCIAPKGMEVAKEHKPEKNSKRNHFALQMAMSQKLLPNW